MLGPIVTATAAKVSPEPGVPETSTKSPLVTEAIFSVAPLALRNTVSVPVVTLSEVPPAVVIVIVLPDTPVTVPVRVGRTISIVVASISSWSEESVPVTDTTVPVCTSEAGTEAPASLWSSPRCSP